jgi:hypothetical protein
MNNLTVTTTSQHLDGNKKMIMEKSRETVKEFLARGGVIKRSEKLLGFTRLSKEYGGNLSAKIGKIIDKNGRKRNGSIGNCNEKLQLSSAKQVGWQDSNANWLGVK